MSRPAPIAAAMAICCLNCASRSRDHQISVSRAHCSSTKRIASGSMKRPDSAKRLAIATYSNCDLGLPGMLNHDIEVVNRQLTQSHKLHITSHYDECRMSAISSHRIGGQGSVRLGPIRPLSPQRSLKTRG
jgi:hypothetical protein